MWNMEYAMRARCGVDRSNMDAVAGVPGRGPIQAKRELAVGRGELIGPAAAAPGGDAAAAPGRALPAAVRGKMEAAFGADFSSVQVHEDGQAAGLGAVAFARGEHLHFQPGRFDPEGADGQALIGHELAHVVQQRAGRVAAPMGKGGVNADPALEAEADQMGARAARGEPTGGATAARAAADDGPAQLQTLLGRNRVAEMRPGQHGGWLWVSGGDPHITIFLDTESRDRLWKELNADRIRRTGDNRLRMDTVPPDFALYYSEFHVTIGAVHYYYDDQGNPLAQNSQGFGISPPFTSAAWANANAQAAQFLHVDRYVLNQRINHLGGNLPVSAQDEQARADARNNFGRNAMRGHLTRLALVNRGRGGPRGGRGGTRGGGSTRGGRGGGQVENTTDRTTAVDKRKLDDSAQTEEETDATWLDEHDDARATKHPKTEHDDDDKGGGGTDTGTGTGTGTGIITTTRNEVSVQ
jgi:hypothetical protein